MGVPPARPADGGLATVTGRPLRSQRGELNAEYAFDLVERIERTNCLKGCIHAEVISPGVDEFVNCSLGILAQVSIGDGEEIPDLEVRNNRYAVCLRREELPAAEQPDPEPDLFEATS